MELIFLKPFMKEILWGGNRIKNEFSYETDSDSIGEAWIVSSNPHGQSIVKNGEFKGLTLKELWDNHREVFGNLQGENFPLLLKYIDANQDLSVQVHPNDEYAREHENEPNGKAECWYVLDCEQDTEIVIGHTSKDDKELKKMVENKKWKELLKTRKIKKGDFFDIPAGTVHAIKSGTLIFETQQNSDITYRFYDYDRLQNGKPRELHIQKSLDVTISPYVEKTEKNLRDEEGEILVKNDYFELKKVEVNEDKVINNNRYFTIICVIEGEGTANGVKIVKGDNFIIPSEIEKVDLKGNLTVIKVIRGNNE